MLMTSGMAGHEYDFYDIVRNSPWLGGSSEYSPLNEGFPYWFNGLVPLAYGLDDSRLISQVRNASEYVLDRQTTDGWIGPETSYDSRTLWARFPFLLGLVQMVQADSSTTPQIVPAMHAFVKLMSTLLEDGKSVDEVWGRARYADMIICLQWLYETYPENNEPLLLRTMDQLRTHGLDWEKYYTSESYLFNDLDTIDIETTSKAFPYVHAVNVGQGLKTGSVNYRFTHDHSSLDSSRTAVNWTFAYHGAASGTIIGDEREAGMAPNRGSELCTAVETLYSLSYLYQVSGDRQFADHSELVAFNALPVMMTPDHWSHQYIAQPNQPWSRRVDSKGLFWNVGDYGQTYGLCKTKQSMKTNICSQFPAPNYPCCTVNHPQGTPKFLSAAFVQIGRDGLAHALLSPASVFTTLPSGALVNTTCDTAYPFSNTLQYSVHSTSAFTFSIRVPSWSTSESTFLSINSTMTPLPPIDQHTGMISLPLAAGQTTIILTLAPALRIEPRANDTIAVYHGALLYALDVGQSVLVLNATSHLSTHPTGAGYPVQPVPPAANFVPSLGSDQRIQDLPTEAHNYEITNTKPWNIAIDPSSLVFHPGPSYSSDQLPNPIWEYAAAPSWISAKGCRIEWGISHGVPDRVPLKGARKCLTGLDGKVEVEDVLLRPYGGLKVHMAELPVVDLGL